MTEWLTNKIPFFEDDELTIKANTFVESMIALETPELAQINAKEVGKCFRRKALQFHPDRLQNRQDISEAQKNLVKLNWYTIEMARDMLLQYCDNPGMMSLELKDMVNKLYCQKHKELLEIDLQSLKEQLEALQVAEVRGEIE